MDTSVRGGGGGGGGGGIQIGRVKEGESVVLAACVVY